MSFINSCNYRVLIVVGWVCQSKVPSSIIMNSVSIGHSQADCYSDDHKEEAIVIDYFLYTDTRLRWIAAPTLLLLLSASSGNNDL
jgi:hypothetical protein